MDDKAAFMRNLAKLKHLLHHLPSQLPVLTTADSRYSHLLESLDKDWEDDIGTHAAANRHLELCFPHSDRVPNQEGLRIPYISERGPIVEALIPFLRRYYTADQGKCYMQKWVVDLVTGAEHSYITHGKVCKRPVASSIDMKTYQIKDCASDERYRNNRSQRQ
jgi:hypothetical protein